jgi:hypothetical protein
VAGIDFNCYESGRHLTFGRPFKLDRHIIVGTVVALQEWFEMDHQARWASYREKVAEMRAALSDLSGIKTAAMYFTMDERLADEPVSCMAVDLPGGRPEAEAICSSLLEGEPSIASVVVDSRLIVAVDTLLDNQHQQVAERLRELLSH